MTEKRVRVDEEGMVMQEVQDTADEAMLGYLLRRGKDLQHCSYIR
jgi:hypothetical protein